VKSNLRKLALATALGSALPSVHAQLINATGTVPPVMDAVQSAVRELQQGDDPKLPLPTRIERMAAFRHTPATADKLRAVFGTEHPFTIARQPARPGDGSAWRVRLQPLHYESAPGSGVDWSEGILDLTLDKAATTVTSTGSWNSLGAGDATMRITANGISSSSHQKRGYAGLWFGDSHVRVASVSFDSKPGATLAMENLSFDWRTVERPKAIEMAYESKIGAVAVAGERVEDLRFALRLTNLDKKALAEMQVESERLRARSRATAAAATPEQQLDTLKPFLRSFGKSALVRGTSLEIDEISARYHGNKASIRGRVALAGAVESDLDDLKSLAKKIVAKFEIRVPLAMVRDIAGVVAAKQAQQQGTATNTQGAAQMGQTMTDVVVGKLVGGGYARLENDVLVSNLEFRGGKLSANGKEVGLPKIAPAGAPPAAVQRSNLPPGALQARRIEDSCRLPDYPAEVVRQDQPLRASFAYRVDAEGKVHEVRVAAPSGFPDWDQAALEALGQCRYIPALQDGKPIELQMNWGLVREAGSKRPRDPNPVP
jgi:TonB family protein